MTTTKWVAGSIQTLASTELNSLAAAAGALGAEYDNTSGLYIFAIYELNVTFGSAPTAGTLVDLYLSPVPDGTNYDDNQSISTMYIGSLPVRAVTTAQKIPLGIGLNSPLYIPPLKFKIRVVNSTNQSFPASGTTLKMVPYQLQNV